MKINVGYVGYTESGNEESGNIIMDLPDTNFVEQFRQFGANMRKLAEDNGYIDLYDTTVEEVKWVS